MAEFDYILISILFGLFGTLIILFSSIISYRNKIKDKPKFSLVSQMIGFLFLFNSFLYQLYPEISEWISQFIGIVSSSPVSGFHYWPYYLFIFAGIIISLFLVKEEDFGGISYITINFEHPFQFLIFISPAIFAMIAATSNSDFLLTLTIAAWFIFMLLLWEKN